MIAVMLMALQVICSGLVVKSTITTAKKIYTETKIANNPVSVVSLAERKLREKSA